MPVLSKIEYDKLLAKIKISSGIEEEKYYDLYHPDDKDSEYLLVYLEMKYADKLSDFLQICKEELIDKFVLKIKG